MAKKKPKGKQGNGVGIDLQIPFILCYFFTRKCQVLVLNFTLAPDANSAGSREERLVRCIGDVIQELLAAHENGRDVNLVT